LRGYRDTVKLPPSPLETETEVEEEKKAKASVRFDDDVDVNVDEETVMPPGANVEGTFANLKASISTRSNSKAEHASLFCTPLFRIPSSHLWNERLLSSISMNPT